MHLTPSVLTHHAAAPGGQPRRLAAALLALGLILSSSALLRGQPATPLERYLGGLGTTPAPAPGRLADGAALREAARVAAWPADAAWLCYQIPAFSPYKRLPHQLPDDARAGRTVRVVAARGSRESASFLVLPFLDMEGVRLEASDLRGEGGGTIAAAQCDLRLVLCWYKGGTAWHSYFSDPKRRTLVPELLVHDQELVRVDHASRDNFVRLSSAAGPVYRWMSYPAELSGRHDVFNHAVEPVADAPRLLPFRLRAGQLQQVWLDVAVPADCAAGVYRGTLTLKAPGQADLALSLQVRVLPFALPEPATYYDPARPFHSILYNTSSIAYYRELLDGDTAAIEAQVVAELRNLREHHVAQPLQRVGVDADGRRQLQLVRQAGMRLDEVFMKSDVVNWQDIYQYGNLGQSLPETRLEVLRGRVRQEQALLHEVLGASATLYAIGWDEPGMVTLRSQQPLFEIVHDLGGRTYSTAKAAHLIHAGFNEDAVNLSGQVERETARVWHALGSKVFAYAYPHTGPENPDFIRRAHGMKLYKSDYDGTANYRYYGYRQNIWNDFTNGSFRIRLVYPTRGGVIDTLHWEGFRAALDDVRYATKLLEVASAAEARGGASARYAGRKARRYLELFREDEDDLHAFRLEVIRHILHIISTMEGGR